MKNPHFNHLTIFERQTIEVQKEALNQTQVAKLLKRHKSTISRELKKRSNKEGIYESKKAHQKARNKRKQAKYQKLVMEKEISRKLWIIKELKSGQSPDAIAGRIKANKLFKPISKNAIYKWLYGVQGEKYCKYLCTKRSRPKKHKQNNNKRQMIPNLLSIHDFKGEIDSEIDQMVSSHNTVSITTSVSRKSKYIELIKTSNHSPLTMINIVNKISEKMTIKTSVLDRGIENRYHEQWRIQAIFADPHSPWQKPLVENTHGLARRWFYPKGTDWNLVSEPELALVTKIINNKYRKSLNYKSATEVALELGIIKT